MSKYIPADKLLAEIERLNSLVPYENNDRHDDGVHDAYKAVKNVIGSLQQERPEVDLENYLVGYFKGWFVDEDLGLVKPDGWSCIVDDLKGIASHFYELGLNAKKEENK